MPDSKKPVNKDILQEAFAEAPMPYHVVDFEGRICDVNKAWMRLLGHERDDVVGRPLQDFLAPGFVAQFELVFKRLQSGGTLPGRVVEMLRANGTSVVTETDIRANFNQSDGSGYAYCLLRDISAQSTDDRAHGNLARRHALILNATPSAIVGFDAEGMVTFSNPATETLTGWTAPDLQGVDLHSNLHGRQRDGTPIPPAECDTCRAMEKQDTNEGQAVFLRKDGTFFDVQLQVQPYFVDGTYVGGVLCFTDITDQVAAAAALTRNEEQMRHLFDSAPVSLWHEDFSAVKAHIDDLKSRGVEDLEFHFRNDPDDFHKCIGLVDIKAVNQATLKLHQAASVTELTNNLAATFTEDAEAVFLKELLTLASGQASAEAVTTVKTLAGDVRHIAFKMFKDPADTHWESVYVAFMDLTSNRQIQDLNARLVTAIEQTGDSVVITDLDGSIRYCNPAFEDITGYKLEEVLGENPRFLKSGMHDDDFYKDIWETISQGEVWLGNFINRRKNGETLEEEASISPILDGDGKIVSYVSVKRDVTHQLNLERRLVQSQKMEAVGQLAGGIAHDFNNILHAMLGHLDFALDGETTPANVERELKMLRGSVGRAGELTRQLLAFSRRQVLELQNTDPNDLIAQLLKMVRRVIGEHISLDFRPGAINREIHVDVGQMEQVLLNLCLNARDAMPDGGTLLIETSLKVVDQKFMTAYSWAQPGLHIRIAVSDNGEGIAPDVLPQIFEPFFTTKDRGRGTGLGLATVYGTVKQHGGMVLVDSESGQGSTFTILLPVAAESLIDEETQNPVQEAPVGGTETILMAEDDEAVRAVINRILTRAGYRILEACDGKEALEVFAKHADEIDLALLDLVMPLVGGPEVAREIEAKRPQTKIIFNSGYSEDAILGRLSQNMNVPLLMKPHDPATLLRAIRKALDGDAD